MDKNFNLKNAKSIIAEASGVPVKDFSLDGKADCFAHCRVRQYLRLLCTAPYLGAP